MSWDIKIKSPARKQLRKIPKKDLALITKALVAMKSNPYGGDIKWIDRSEKLLRRRVGNWRIFFTVYQDILYVEIISVRRRTSKTYNK